jgi:hypothetical protein
VPGPTLIWFVPLAVIVWLCKVKGSGHRPFQARRSVRPDSHQGYFECEGQCS